MYRGGYKKRLTRPPSMPVVRTRAPLAARADVGAAARGSHLLDLGAAAHAGLALSHVDQETVLEGAAGAVDVPVVVDGGALRVDPGVEGVHDGVAERLDLRAPKRDNR